MATYKCQLTEPSVRPFHGLLDFIEAYTWNEAQVLTLS